MPKIVQVYDYERDAGGRGRHRVRALADDGTFWFCITRAYRRNPEFAWSDKLPEWKPDSGMPTTFKAD